MLNAARLHTKWGPRAPGAAHLGPGRPGGFPVGPRSPIPPDPARLPRTLFSAMGSLSCSADITDRRAWLAPGPREAGVFDAVAPPPPGPPSGPPGPPPGPRGPPGRARSPGLPGRGPTLKSLGGGRGLGAPHTRGAQPGSGPRPGGGARARPAEYARPGPRCAAFRPRAGETRPPRTQKPPACSGRSGDVARPRGLPAPPVLHNPARGRASGAGTQGARSPAPSLAPARSSGAAASLAGRLRCAPGLCAPGPALTPSPYAPGSPRPPRPITPGSATPVRAPQLGLHVLRCPPRPKTPWLRAPYEGRKGATSCSALPAALQGPKPPNSASRSSAPGAALCPSGPKTPGSTPLCTPSPAPDSPRKQQLATSSQPQQAS